MGEGNGLEKRGEGIAEEGVDLGLTVGLITGAALAEEAEDLVGFEVDAFDLVVVTATLDGGPVHDGGGGGAERIAQVGLLIDFLGTGTGLAIGDELFGGEARALDAVDHVEKAQLDGVNEGDAVIKVPGRFSDGELRIGVFD